MATDATCLPVPVERQSVIHRRVDSLSSCFIPIVFMEPFIGQVQLFAFNFAPKDWAFCNGQLMSIAQNQALFSLIGTTYGGDGVTTFALPDLRGRVPNHFGQGPGLNSYEMGQVSGTETVTLIQTQMPTHTHPMMVSNQTASVSDPTGHVLAASTGLDSLSGATVTVHTYGTNPTGVASPQTIGIAGGNQSHNNMQPYLTMNYCIALYGIYPSRT